MFFRHVCRRKREEKDERVSLRPTNEERPKNAGGPSDPPSQPGKEEEDGQR